jgi:tetratricopeptide (TPR) repeat protein
MSVVLSALAASGQTYEVKPGAPVVAAGQTGRAATPDRAAPAGQDMGWGSNIQNARLAHAAEMALQRGDHALAFTYAQRAAETAPNDPQIWFLLGYAARLNGRYGPAADAYQHGLRLRPGSIDGMAGLAQAFNEAGRTADAERLLKLVVEAAPGRRNELAMLGEIYMKQGNYTGALEWLGKAERVEPTAQSELLLSVAYLRLKQMDMASHYLDMARSRDPNNPDVERSLAAFYRDTLDYPKAIEALTRIRNPRPEAIAELGYTYELAGRPEDAAEAYSRAADLLPRDINLQLSAAQALVAIPSLERAETFLRRAEKVDAGNYRLHAIRGTIARLQDREADAAREFSAAIAVLPTNPPEGPLYGIQLQMDLVPLYRDLNEPKQSRDALTTAQKMIAAVDEHGAETLPFLRIRSIIHFELEEYDAALRDLKTSLTLKPNDPNVLQLEGDVLMKLARTEEAVSVFEQVLKLDPHSRFALTSLGFASRAAGKDVEAERYFNLLAKEYPASFVPYLALGDMYTEQRDYKKAQVAYDEGYQRAAGNAMIVAGGLNASIESHDLPLAGEWQKRVTAGISDVPQVLRQEERYFYFTGNEQRSMEIGRQAIKLLPRDREVAVYLGYDLLHMQQWDELKALTEKYIQMFPKEPDVPLLAGYVYKHSGDLDKAVEGFSEALRRDPTVATAYTNRGFVYNDLHKPDLAARDFESSIKLKPNDPEAHMGLAFADLNLRRPAAAIEQTQRVEALAGDSELIHAIRATAYGRMGMLAKSSREYVAALKFTPDDASLYLGLANIYFAQRRYHEALDELQAASKNAPDEPATYALMARANAELKNRDEVIHDVQLAEQYATQGHAAQAKKANEVVPAATASEIYVATGQALSILGDKEAAMIRYGKALTMLPKDRVSVRLAVAQEMAKAGHVEDAERQLALAQMEVAAKDAEAPTGEQYIAMAGVLQELHEYELSQGYLEKAKDAGAPDAAVRISMANSYLAMGESRRAAAELSAVKKTEDSDLDYQYLLAEASLAEQEHRAADAVATFAAATSDAGDDPTAEQGLLEAGGTEGYRVNSKVSILSTLVVQPIFEDSTVYVLDSKLNSPSGPVGATDVARLPPPRSSIETNFIAAFHLHLAPLPANSGFFEVRNAQGTISVPATGSVVNRNTTDYGLNFALDPSVHLGNNVVTFNSGIQGTLRRDTQSPVEINQNLFRVFTYMTTSSFFNAVSANGFVSAEVGSFTETPITTKMFNGAINFRVGLPWGKTALLTGWGSNDQRFDSSRFGNSQNFTTTSYVGLSRQFAKQFSAAANMEEIRSWRTEPYSPIHAAIAQAIRPVATFHYSPTRSLDLQAASSYENTRGFHVYDMLTSSFTVTYERGLDRTFNEQTGKVHLKYPLRMSVGLRQEDFVNFGLANSQKFLPFFSITLF